MTACACVCVCVCEYMSIRHPFFFPPRSAVFPGGEQATGQNCWAGRDPDKTDRKREEDVCIGACVCARASKAGRANIYLVRVKNKKKSEIR